VDCWSPDHERTSTLAGAAAVDQAPRPGVEQALDRLLAGEPGGVDPKVEAWATPLPETKLNRPFKFTNLY